jgi:hypothetical protein
MPPISVLTKGIPNDLLTQGTAVPNLFTDPGVQPDLSPDFFTGDFGVANTNLSSYLGEILSGSYIP